MYGRRPWILLAVVLAASIVACSEEAGETGPTSTTMASGEPSNVDSPAPTPAALPATTLVFLRGDASPEAPVAGAIWITDFDGTGARQLTPDGVEASYAGVSPSKSGSYLLYYITQDADGNTIVHSSDLRTGNTEEVLAYRDIPKFYFAAISPDGRYLVHTQPLGLDMYDLATGTSVTLFQSGRADCLTNLSDPCYRATNPDWSPDGRLLRVLKVFYEGGWAQVVDPFKSPAAVIASGDQRLPGKH